MLPSATDPKFKLKRKIKKKTLMEKKKATQHFLMNLQTASNVTFVKISFFLNFSFDNVANLGLFACFC